MLRLLYQCWKPGALENWTEKADILNVDDEVSISLEWLSKARIMRNLSSYEPHGYSYVKESTDLFHIDGAV